MEYPETCKEAQDNAIDETGERPSNGTYTLYVNGDKKKPWEAYCHNMNRTEPSEYLTVDTDSNFSQASKGSSVTKTSFRRLRIDPSGLEIDPLDDTFATTETEGASETFPDDFTFVPAGFSQYGGPGASNGVPAEASVDLSGTGFVFAEKIVKNDLEFFCTVAAGMPGAVSGSSAEVSSDLSRFNLKAFNDNETILTKTVADCTHMGDDPVDSGVLPLQYVGD